MPILLEVKKEYNQILENIIKGAIGLNKIIDLNKRLIFLSHNKNIGINQNVIKNNNEKLKLIQQGLDNYIKQLELQLMHYIDEEIEDIDIFVNCNQDLSYIFEKYTES